jgi:hypothetical protein
VDSDVVTPVQNAPNYLKKKENGVGDVGMSIDSYGKKPPLKQVIRWCHYCQMDTTQTEEENQDGLIFRCDVCRSISANGAVEKSE